MDAFPSTLAAAGGAGNIDLIFDPQGSMRAIFSRGGNHQQPGGVPGTETEIPIQVNSAPDPDLSVAATVTLPGIPPSTTRQMQIPGEQLGHHPASGHSGVAITGPDADKFSLDSFPSSIPAASSSSIAVTFDPDGGEGSFSATLEITCNDEGFEGMVVSVNLFASTDLLGVYLILRSWPHRLASMETTPPRTSSTARQPSSPPAGGGAGTPLSHANGTLGGTRLWCSCADGSDDHADSLQQC